jgi:hypothetical protein
MNTLQGDGADVTAPALASQHLGSTAAISAPQLELAPEPAPAAVSPVPVLITEKQVLFSTAAAVPVRSTAFHWWSEVTGVALAAIHRMQLTSRADARQPRQYCPKRYAFLEESCMAREMGRL